MNVALIIQNLKGGGAERAVSKLSQHLAEKYNMYIVLFDGSEIAYDYKGKLIDLQSPVKPGVFGEGVNVLDRVVKLYKVFKDYEIDVAVSFMEAANLVNLLTVKRKVKKYVSVREHKAVAARSAPTFYTLFFSKVIKGLYKNADGVVAVSNEVKNDLVGNFLLEPAMVKVIKKECQASAPTHRWGAYLSESHHPPGKDGRFR